LLISFLYYFNISIGNYLLLQDSEILCWDIRNLGQIMQVINRDVTTNQRIYFDITQDCRKLVTGNDNGKVAIFDISSEEIEDHSLQPINCFDAHNDCVNGVRYLN
jgi:telomerase Cajal body protein 1